MFTGDDDLLNLIQIEANTLVDTVLEESVSIVNQSSFNPSSYAQDNDYDDNDNVDNEDQHDQLSREVSYDEYSYEQPQPPFQLQLNTNNNNSINNPPISDHAPISDEISENFAIKSDYDIIVKSPTIESMSGKSFEDVDDDINYTAISAIHDVSLDNSALHSNDNITATNITPSTSILSHELDTKIEDASDKTKVEDIVQVKAQKLVDNVLHESLQLLDQDDYFSNDFKSSPISPSVTFASENDNIIDFEDYNSSNDDPAIVRNISEQKLKRVERKFEHLSSEVRDDDPATVDDLVNKEDISMLQTDFSKISWDESLSATTGDFGSSTPDNDLQDVLNIPGDTYRYQHNK